MDADLGRYKMLPRYGFFDPADHVVARATRIVTEIMVETDLGHIARFERRNDLIRPVGALPPWRFLTHVIEKNPS